MTEQLARLREIAKETVAKKYPDITARQNDRLVDTIMTDERVLRRLNAIGDAESVSFTCPYTGLVADAARIVEADPTLIERPPSPADVARHLVEQRVAVLGADRRPELMVQAMREAESMSEDQRIESGAKASPVDKPTPANPGGKVPLYKQDYNWEGWSGEIMDRTGKHAGTLLPSERKALIDGIRNEARQAAGLMHPADEIEVARILGKPEDQRTPSEKINLHRLTAKA